MIEERAADDYSRTWGMYAHLAGLLTFTSIPLAGIVGPLIVREQVKSKSAFAAEQARLALNFHITTGVLYVILIAAAIVAFVRFLFTAHGLAVTPPISAIAYFALAALVYLWTFAFTVYGTIRSSRGELYRYPLTIPFVR